MWAGVILAVVILLGGAYLLCKLCEKTEANSCSRLLGLYAVLFLVGICYLVIHHTFFEEHIKSLFY